MRALLLITVVLFSACKKDEAKPAATTDPKAGSGDPAKPAEPGAAPASPPATTPPPAPSGPPVANAAEYEKKAIEMTDKLLAIFAAGGKNCDRLATDMTKFATEHRGTFEALKAFEKANPDAEKAFDDKMKGREKEFEEKLSPAFEACKDHDGLKKAMGSLPM